MNTILIVEDDAILRDILANKLRNAGYTIALAGDGEEALKVIKETHPSLVLLDILIPKKNGEEVLAEMQANAALKTIPVIAISNSGDPSEISRIQNLGVKDFLVKALFDANDIVGRVGKIIGAGTNAPAAASAAPAAPVQAPAAPTPTPPQAAPAQASSSGKHKILIVEDDKFLRELAGTKLEHEGFQVLGATDGREAIDMVTKENPEVVILDLILPNVDGYEVLRTLRAKPEYAKLPIIVLSNMGSEEDIKKAKDLGATDFLIKAHFSFGDIIKKIHEVLAYGK